VGFFAVWFAGVGFMKTPEAAIHLLMAAYFVHLAIRAGYLTLRYRHAPWRPSNSPSTYQYR
jgi:hypothetical protein